MRGEDFLLNEAGDKLIVVFSSYGVEGTPGATAFARPKLEFIKTLSGYHLSCLFLMDRQQHWYHSGVFDLADSIPSLADKLLPLKHRYSKIATLGHSMGGYAALLFASLCDFDQAIATAPQTSITRDHRLAWGDHRWPEKVPETRGISRTPEYFDLATALSNNNKPTYRCYFSSTDALDRRHCEHISGIRSVEVSEVEAPDHNTAKALRDGGSLDLRLTEFAES